MGKIRLLNIISLCIILITIVSVRPWNSLPLGNTYSNWTLYFISLFLFFFAKKYYYNTSNNRYIWIFNLYIIWILISILRGFFEIEGYWDWKNFISGIHFTLVASCFYIFTNPRIVQKILSDWLLYALPLFVPLTLFMVNGAYGFYLAPLILLTLFLPIINKKWQIIILCFVLLILSAYTNRSSLLKFGVAFLISGIYYIRHIIIPFIFKSIHLILMLIPFLFFSLAITDVFNIFEMEEYLGEQTTERELNGEIREEKLTADTRTFLYKEVIYSAIDNDYIITGRSIARGNDSAAFGTYFAEEQNTGRYERFSNEVGLLNIFTWLGIIGVILYFLVFFQASFLAIYKSNNLVIKIIGLYVSFRWIISWVEDPNRFNILNISLWMMIAMCFSEQFRKMSNKEFKIWAKGIFEKKYRKKFIKE